MKVTDKYVLFWGGHFSQWSMYNITIDGISFNCNEQYMMFKKAMIFGDTETAQKIMETDSPRIQKKLGRQVKNFNKDVWDSVCKDIVFRANFAKFTQNEYLYQYVITEEWKDKIFVEASPEDKIWGIGLHFDDPLALDESTWQGTNYLGEAITNVRDALIIENP